MSPAATKVRAAVGGDFLKGRYRNFLVFVEAGMSEDEAAICAILSEADEIARDMKNGDAIRAKLIEAQATISLFSMSRKAEEIIERRRSERVGKGPEDDGGREKSGE